MKKSFKEIGNEDGVAVCCPPDSDHEKEYFWLFNIKSVSPFRVVGHWYIILGKGIMYKNGIQSQ